MKTIFIIAFFIFALASAKSNDSDTVWTKDLWKFGPSIEQIQFTPDGDHIAVAIGGGVYILDKQTGQFVKQFNKYMGNCLYFTFTPDGTKLITSSYDENYIGKIIVWDYKYIDTIKTYNDLAIQEIVALDNQTIFGIWNLSAWHIDSSKACKFNFMTGEILNNERITGRPSYIDAKSLPVLKNKNLFAVIIGSEGTDKDKKYVSLYDINTYAKISDLGYHNSIINDLAFSNDGKYLASAGSDGLIKIWDLDTKTLIKTLTHISMEDGYLNVKFSPNSGYLVSSGGILYDFTTKIWDLQSFNVIYEYKKPYGAQYALNISQDSSYIIISGGPLLFLLNAHWLPTEVKEQPIGTLKVLYPNPVTDYIEIMDMGDVKIYDVLGIEHPATAWHPTTEGNVRIDVSGLPKGVYFVSVGGAMYKFVKI